MDCLKTIEDVLNSKIRPELSGHGGYIESVSFEDGVYCYYISGQCCTCPTGTMHIEMLLMKELKPVLPKLERVVRQVVSNDAMDMAMQILSDSEEKYNRKET